MNSFPPDDRRSKYFGRVIAVGGPPHSGKTVLLNALHDELIKIMGDKVFKEPVCPDGEGRWAAEANPQVVQKLRRKGCFSDEFMEIKLAGIEGLASNKNLVLLDLGGLISEQNSQILQYSTELLILSSKPEAFMEWEQSAQRAHCRTIGHLLSELSRLPNGDLDLAKRSTIDTHVEEHSAPFVTGHFYNLDRNAPKTCYATAIQQLAKWLNHSMQ